jgi:transcriptional regulator with XRE-family HTH domain
VPPARAVRMDPAFAARLVEWMARRGMRPGELARRLGVIPGTVSRWRKGECPDDLRYPEIAAALRIDLEWLKTGAGVPEPEDQSPRQGPGRRASDKRLAAEELVKRLTYLREQIRSYAHLGHPPGPDVLAEWLRLTADVMEFNSRGEPPLPVGPGTPREGGPPAP